MGLKRSRCAEHYKQECESSGESTAASKEKKLVVQLYELRMRSGFNQIELAEKSGCTQNTISRVETGLCRPTLRTICSILDALGYELKIVKKS